MTTPSPGDYIESSVTSGTVTEIRSIAGRDNAVIKTRNGFTFHIPLSEITKHVKKEDLT